MFCFKSTVNTVFAFLFFGKSLKPIDEYIANMVKHCFHPKVFTKHSGELMNHHTYFPINNINIITCDSYLNICY